MKTHTEAFEKRGRGVQLTLILANVTERLSRLSFAAEIPSSLFFHFFRDDRDVLFYFRKRLTFDLVKKIMYQLQRKITKLIQSWLFIELQCLYADFYSQQHSFTHLFKQLA